MKNILLISILSLTYINIFAQKLFTLNSSVGLTKVQVNGKQYQVDSAGSKIKTNYPKFDTLVFVVEDASVIKPIICNFKPDSVYTIADACCATLDIIPASKFKHDSLSVWFLDPEKNFGKIQNVFCDIPFITIKTLQNPKDSTFAWHADAACLTECKLINKEPWILGVPPKCYYWSNITTIQFFKTDNTIAKHVPTHLETFISISNIVELTNISFRLFDNQRFVIVYDCKKKIATLSYE